jgi:hypothetical protein
VAVVLKTIWQWDVCSSHMSAEIMHLLEWNAD